MADVSISPPDGDRLRNGDGFRDADRGQLLLLSALVMAVSLVTLVVLLNATIYSENVATRGIEAADGEALEVRATAVEGTGSLIDTTNRNAAGDYGEVEQAVGEGIGELDTHVAKKYTRRGGITSVENRSGGMREGRYLTGDLSGTQVTDNVSRTREFVLEVDQSTLASANASTAKSTAFHVVLNSTNGTREVYVYNQSNGNVTVAIGDDGGTPTVRCEVDPETGGPIAVDLTGGRLDGRPCFDIWPTARLRSAGKYTIEFANLSAADGNATATVMPASGDAVASDLTATEAVYDAEIDIRYRTADLRFETTVRVAPGEPDA